MIRLAHFATTTVAALGIAIAPVPAAADSDDLAKILAGIVVTGIIAKAIDDRNDEKSRKRSGTRTEYGRFGTSDGRYRERDRRRVIEGRITPYDREDGKRHGPKDGRGYKKQALPEQCLLRVETARGDRLAYGARCLDQRYKFSSKLPSACETVVRTRRGYRAVYGAHCLARDGWRVARR